MTLGEAVDHYLGDVARRCAPRTHRKYEQCLDTHSRSFVKMLGAKYPISEVRSEHCLQWLSNWNNAKPKTQALHDTALRELFKFLVRMDYLEPNDNPMLKVVKVKVPPIEDRDVKTISSEEVKKVIAACQTWTEMLTVAIFACMGVRRQAACDLRWKDVRFTTGHIKFQEKGRKTIWKPMPAMLDSLLREAHADLDVGPDDYVIPNLRTPKNAKRDPHFIWRTIKEVSKRAGVDAHCHSFRAAFAVHYLETHTGDLEALQPLMGHKHLATTQGYLRRLQKETAMERVRDLDWGTTFGALSEGEEQATLGRNSGGSHRKEALPPLPTPSLSALTEGVKLGQAPPLSASPSVSASSEPPASFSNGSSPLESFAEAARSTYVCKHCGAEVTWGFPRPEDPCLECGKPIGQDVETVSIPEEPETVRRLSFSPVAAGLGFEPRFRGEPASIGRQGSVSLPVDEMAAIVALCPDYLTVLTTKVETYR